MSKEIRKEIRMIKFFKYTVRLILLILIISICITFYAFKIEPFRLTTNYIQINETNDLSMKVVQFSDVHIKKDFTVERLEKVVKRINQENADIVIFTGDLYDNFAKYKDNKQLINVLSKIEAKHAKIAIWGNRDYGGGAVRMYQNVMENSGFIVLKNQNQVLTLDNNKRILLTGLDDGLLGRKASIPGINESNIDYKILLAHEPDIVEPFVDHNYDLILSGHSYGGQINIPFLPSINEKALRYSKLVSKYQSGINQISEDTLMYVNTGIGTTHISARLGVVPEIAVLTVYLD